MQQERLRDGDVKVDRVQLQKQLQQFELDKEKMRNRGMDYSPRFRSGNDLKMTGSGDNRSTSPTFPLNSRVSGKEKRRRVHAWLGAQIRSEVESTMNGQCSSQRTARLPNLPAPELPSFANALTPATDGKIGSPSSPEKEGSDLLRSRSEFIPGNVVPSNSRSFEDVPHGMHHPVNTPMLGNAGFPCESLYTQEASTRKAPVQPWSVKTIEDGPCNLLTPDYTGGGDNYCYVYDPAIAKAYTKKYSVSPSINTPPPSAANGTAYPSNTATVKYAPASQNFTPSPALPMENVPATKPYARNALSSENPGSTKFPEHQPHMVGKDLISMMPSPHFPTKYEEYDMRPIKPLDADMKKSLYGEAVSETETKQGSKSSQPRPYLRRSHTTGVSYPVPKTRNNEKSRPAFRVQANVENKRKALYTKGSPRPSPSSPRRKRLNRKKQKDKSAKYERTKTGENQETVESEADTEETPSPEGAEADKNTVPLPVDLKHVKAATKIQAVWKGYRTRKLDPKVVEIRTEVRARRAEQYISVLCHEVQCLKENLEAERKMKDLQTEAIRYIWAQLRILQKSRNGTTDRRDASSKRKSPDRRPRSKSNSPRRGMKRGNKRCSPHGSPHGTPRETNSSPPKRHDRHPSESSALDFDEDMESIVSDLDHSTQKKADVSWKEVPDEQLFGNRKNQKQGNRTEGTSGQNPEDTDEGRGTLVTDGEGNPAHSSAEEESPSKPIHSSEEKTIITENLHLKSTVQSLQDQVAQLQEAMVALSDKILNRSRSDTNLDVWEEGDELKLASESQEISMVTSPPKKLDHGIVCEKPAVLDPEPALSARGEVPRVSLKDALITLRSALSEDELWALCEQAGNSISSKTLTQYLALENTYIRKDGRVEFSEFPVEGTAVDEMYLAPEVLEDKSAATVKSSVFSLSVVLWSAADWEMSAEQAPQLSQDLESLLVIMSQDDVAQRAEVGDVIRICEDHHAKAGANSLRICSSLFAEVDDALLLAKSGKLIQKKIAQEVSKDQEVLVRKAFKELVVPDINSGSWHTNLKPVSERVLSPRPCKEPTPHEKLMRSLSSTQHNLRSSPHPKVFSVRDMFLKNPQLVHNLNILPGQRRKNQKAMQLVLRRRSPKDPSSAPLPGIPTPPRALRAGVSDSVNASGLSSVILRWHPAKIFDKHGQEAQEDKIIGYRIYVNGHPKGMVAGTKSRALLEGLRQLTEYRVNVRAISALGESDVSNTVIAHITSPPMSRGLEVNCSEHRKAKSCKSEEFALKKSTNRTEGAPTAQPRKEQLAPQARPRLGAVFPKQNGSDKSEDTKNSVGADSRPSPPKDEASPKAESQKGDDIIDRVLRRYGIQQTAAIVPGYASGSTLSPIPTGYRPKSCTSTETNRKSAQSSLLEDMTKSLETSSVSSRGSSTTENPSVPRKNSKPSPNPEQGGATPVSPTSADVTSKSLELLAQLKSELLS